MTRPDTLTPGLVVCELRAVATALRLGGLDALRRSTITPTPTGAVLTLRAHEQERRFAAQWSTDAMTDTSPPGSCEGALTALLAFCEDMANKWYESTGVVLDDAALHRARAALAQSRPSPPNRRASAMNTDLAAAQITARHGGDDYNSPQVGADDAPDTPAPASAPAVGGEYLQHVVRKLSRARARFLEVHAEAVVTGSTEYERRASEGEIADRAAEVLHQELSDFGFVEISAVLEAITASPPPRADDAAGDVAALRTGVWKTTTIRPGQPDLVQWRAWASDAGELGMFETEQAAWRAFFPSADSPDHPESRVQGVLRELYDLVCRQHEATAAPKMSAFAERIRSGVDG